MAGKGNKIVTLGLGLFFVLAAPIPAQEFEPVRAVDGDETAPVPGDSLSGVLVEEQEVIPSLIVKSLDMRVFLRQIAEWQKVNIIMGKDVSGEVNICLYGVTFEQILDAVLLPYGFDYERRGNFITVMKTEMLQALRAAPQPPEVHVYRFSYMTIPDARELLMPFLSKGGEIKAGAESMTGIPTGSSDTGGESNSGHNVLVIKDIPEVHERIKEALKEIDVRPKQVLVEATILEVTLDDTNRLGVNFNALGGVDFSELGATSDLFSANTGTATGGMIDNTFNHIGTRGFTDQSSQEGFSIGILKGDLAFFIDALESVTDTNVLANPKILALNRQRAEIIIGGRLGYYGSETLSEGGFSQQEVEFLEVGTQLRFRPFIGEDDFIRLEIHPQRSNGVVDSTTGLPSETTSEVTTNVMVKDGDTIVLGGLIEEKDTQEIARVPVLGSIPIIGWLFRKESTNTVRTEIIVLITPKIIDPGDTDETAEGMIAEHARRSQRFRHGFYSFTRTLSAERHLAKAKRDLDAGRLQWARFHLWWVMWQDPLEPDITAMEQSLIRAEKGVRNSGGKEGESLEEYVWSELK